ncbi:MAG TPA: SpoIIE family protein phosphatase [Acidobacteriota bacterium]|nr:SpoIIE family protein phosphatase [Acidobacteriota bacterium]
MRRLLPKTRMGMFTLILIVLWTLKSLLVTNDVQRSLSAGQRFTLNLLTPLLAVPAIYYLWKMFSVIRRRLLWKIRRRLILAHIFIGAIPVFLVLLILYVTALLFYYQLTYYLLSNQIGIHTAQIHAFNLSLRAGLQETMIGGASNPSMLKSVLDRDAKYILGAYRSAAIVLRVQDPSTERTLVFGNRNVNAGLISRYQIPRWAGDRDFSGLVLEDSQPEVYGSLPPGRGNEGRLFLRSLVFSDFRPEMPFSLEISVPFDRDMLDRLKAAMGQDLLLADHISASGLNVMLQNTDFLQKNVLSATFEMEDSQQSVGRPVWSILLFPISWNLGSEATTADSDVLFVELNTSKLIQNVFRSESNVSKTIIGVLQIVIGFFLVVEIVSLVIGILLTKSITKAVYNLDRGTDFVKRGDFSHRIVVKSDDQLGTLAESFNQMTEYVQTLVKERVEKERLERELEIAKEVQEQLFPREAPRLQGLELTGLCLPARVVSGDYYDFVPFGVNQMGIALGDICGKGISAALLMANLQATLRTNVMNMARLSSKDGEHNPGGTTVAHVVQMLNEQIYNFTSANKFASLFYGVYDAVGQTLSYCNAGHNPPLFFNGGKVQKLYTGGTVVGIFPDAEYDQETIQMHPGDLFLAYTDGIVESVNEYGEEFGEDRLIDIVRKNRESSADELQRVIVDQVLAWAYEEERDDDMTLIVARIR